MKDIRRFDEEIERLRRRSKDSEDLKILDDVFDVPTLKALYRLASKDIINAISTVIQSKSTKIVILFSATVEQIANIESSGF